MTLTTAVDVQVRWLIDRDMPDVLAIEKSSFDIGWTRELFRDCLMQRNCVGMVAEIQERVGGFMVYELLASHIHILDFAVDLNLRRQGIGGQMVNQLIAKLTQQRRSQLVVEVRETNLDAQLFFRAYGFIATSILRRPYDDSNEDAYVMRYDLVEL